ncbi:MAG TPA: 23S rRNA (uracil(1939)-C(5))-methyltransferase RlmD [Ignavibacteria bacterium]|nr:23S rRNA (uracil(1939)-C(5))-methyltransferase RlmD [Ignavibacteria bacterium]
MIKKGDELSINVIELNSEGRGVSKLEDGFVIFSTGTLPGDEALVKISKKKSSYAEAKLKDIIKPSEFRLDPVCGHFGVCGGCKIQNYDYDKQLEYKVNVVKNAIARIGGFKDLVISEAVKAEDIFFYRNKMEFSFSDDEWLTDLNSEDVKQKFALGLHVPKFHSKIVNIEKCFLQSNLSNDVLNFTREFFKSRDISVYSTKTHTGYLRFLIIRQSSNTKDFMVNLITYDHDEMLMKEYCELLRNNFPGITTIINSISDKKAQVATGESEFVLHGSGHIFEKLRSSEDRAYEFKISPQSFFQTNTLQAEKLFKVIKEFGDFNKEDNVLDLYCGAGSISIFISDLVAKVLGAELVEDAVKDANVNKEINKTENIEFVCTDIKDFLTGNEKVKDYNKLILDPPRSGLHPKICEILSETDFEKIIYVSCNPHTQARDLQIICGAGKYEIDKIRPVDMFPHTYHVENVISLNKK